MKNINKSEITKPNYPVKVLQFGEGNFLRAFVDWMINKANHSNNLNKGVVLVQPLANGMVPMLKAQDNLYHVVLEGIKEGKPVREIDCVDCIVDAVNPYNEYEQYKNYFLSEDLEFVISNTTEAGISRVQNEDIYATPPQSFPGKVCALLLERFKKYNGDTAKGLTFICCELIENNATTLKEIVLELAAQNNLDAAFVSWINSACHFCNSLVDRIVTGFPKDTIKELQAEIGFEDNMLVTAEYYHLWAIDANPTVMEKFPLHKAGLHVEWVSDMKTFRDKKVRVLNGAHTALVPVGLLAGHETVKEAFAEADVEAFIRGMVDAEVLPNIEGDTEELKAFAAEILDRFFNPYIKHYLKDISLNSLSKWVTRDLPSLKDYQSKTTELPERLSLSLAALLALYHPENKIGFKANDTPELLTQINQVWTSDTSIAEQVKSILSNTEIWGEDLNQIGGLSDKVATFFTLITEKGMQHVLQVCS
ncbi:tagaturonate reductase [Saccharicrinis aurantiacus]|uniref:tagaturonate reductase n=1 Tax=Saccharicrinis aurantiacus TaxID=1849719 RepID=UPI002493CB79|nr:tagaturonate reductase [Saccharicrinis aurantiacus]